LDSIRSAFDFHMQLEPPLAFVRREWRTLALCGGIFAAIMVAGIVLVDPAFFYPRLQTDPLNYYLKADALVRTGSTSAKWAVNLGYFPYAAMPGVLRVPALLMFTEFDDQLRAMQVLNIPILGSVAVMSAYILSWLLPRDKHRVAIIFAFAFTLLSPVWIANVFLPLADAPYAAFTLAAILLTISIVCSPTPVRRRPLAVATLVLLFAIAFAIRFTAPALIAFGGILAMGRWNFSHVRSRAGILIGVAGLAFLTLLVRLNASAIFGRYFSEPLAFVRKGDKPGMLLNLFGVALPSEVVPNFVSGYLHPPIEAHFHTKFFISPRDTIWLLIGLAIGAIIVAGIWSARKKLLPEIVYFLLPLPVLALMLPSTTRYVMTYQPFVWLFFYAGVLSVAARVKVVHALVRNAKTVAAILLLAFAGTVGLRVWRFGGSSSERVHAVSAAAVPSYISDVSTTFRGLRGFLESLPKERTLLIGDKWSMGRWKLIADRDYYYPDSTLARIASTKDIYVLAECGTMEICQGWGFYKDSTRARVNRFGNFGFDSVYAFQLPRAKVQVYRIHSLTEQ
jgi:hypothetical protein